MSKTLILPGTNFSANKIEKITFTDGIPCTALSLSSESATISTTLTLTATPTPENTTDNIVWSTSDSNVAVVNDGIVTAIANGTATITATCGEQAAMCLITVSIPMYVTKQGLLRVNAGQTKPKEPAAATVGDRYITIGMTNGTYHALGINGTGRDELLEVYPYKIPSGATKINVACSDVLAPIIVFYDSETKASGLVDFDCAKVLDGQTPTSGSQWSISGWEYGNKSFDVSSVTDVDSFTISFYTKTASAYNNFDKTNPGITITFGYT